MNSPFLQEVPNQHTNRRENFLMFVKASQSSLTEEVMGGFGGVV